MIGPLVRGWALLPLPLLRVAATVVGDAWFFLVRVRRAVALQNLARSALDPGGRARLELVRRSCRHLVLNILELPRWLSRPDLAFFRDVQVDGEAHLGRGLGAGRGVLVVSAHLGNWELLGTVAHRLGHPVALVVRRPAGRWARRFVTEMRRRGGAQIIEEGPGAERAIRRALRAGSVVGFAVDQRPPPGTGAMVVPFLGRAARIQCAPAVLSVRTGAPLVVAWTHRTPGGHRVCIEPPLDPARLEGPGGARARELTRRYSRSIERAVSRAPDQWLWHHRRWERDGPARVPGGAALEAGTPG